jgi:hypothetical protein
MADISIGEIKRLRELTGVGITEPLLLAPKLVLVAEFRLLSVFCLVCQT